MLLSEFDYDLPEELIAQTPADKRENSRMLVLNREKQTIEHKHFFDIVDLIDSNSILVLNDTKVLPARLYAYKDTGAKIEVFLLKMSQSPRQWEVLIKPAKRVKPDMVLKVSDELSVKLIKELPDNGKWLIELLFDGTDVMAMLHRNGNVPLPPYIERKMTNDEIKKLDFERYQTV